MGVLKLQQNEAQNAINWIERAIQSKPCDYFYETFFQACIRAGLYERIISCEKMVLENYSKNFSLLFNLALAYKNLKQNIRAISFYEKDVNALYTFSLYDIRWQRKTGPDLFSGPACISCYFRL